MDKLYKTIDEDKISERQDLLRLKEKNNENLGGLFGKSIALEDNISTKGIRTSVGSKMLENYIPPFDATVVERLLDEDAIIRGKIDTREFGVGMEIDSKLGRVINDGDTDISIGVDASGEIRNIASFEGLYGLKPTYGSISRYGVIGSAPSFEQVGIIAKDVNMMRTTFEAIATKDNRDSTSLERPEVKLKDLRKIKMLIPKEYIKNLDSLESDQMDKVLTELVELGFDIECIDIPTVKYAESIYNILQSAEFSSDMGKFDGVLYGYSVEEHTDTEDFFKRNRTEGFSIDVKKKIMFGNFVLSKDNYEDYYEKSQKIRTLIIEEIKKQFGKYDIILNPILGKDIKYTVLANITGLPAISLPSLDKEGFGIQFMADDFNEELLFEVAQIYGDKTLASREGER